MSTVFALCIGVCPGVAHAIAVDACEHLSENTEVGAIVADLKRIVTLPEKPKSDGDPTASAIMIGINIINSRLAAEFRSKSVRFGGEEDCVRAALSVGLYKTLYRSIEGNFDYEYGRRFLEFEIISGIRGPFSSYIKVAPSTVWRVDDRSLIARRWGAYDQSDENVAANLTAICIVEPDVFSSSMINLGFDRKDILRIKNSSEPRLSVQGAWLVKNCMKGGE